MLSEPATIRVTDGLRMTTPAVVTLIGYLLLAIIVMVPFDMYAWDETRSEYVRYKYNVWQRLLVLLLLLFPLLLGVYSVNCFVVGRCIVLSWVVAAVTVVWSLAVIIAAFMNRSFNLDDVVA